MGEPGKQLRISEAAHEALDALANSADLSLGHLASKLLIESHAAVLVPGKSPLLPTLLYLREQRGISNPIVFDSSTPGRAVARYAAAAAHSDSLNEDPPTASNSPDTMSRRIMQLVENSPQLEPFFETLCDLMAEKPAAHETSNKATATKKPRTSRR